jgi:lipoate synthase
VPLGEFAELRDYALSNGFAYAESGPLVRSSYRAERALEEPPETTATTPVK